MQLSSKTLLPFAVAALSATALATAQPARAISFNITPGPLSPYNSSTINIDFQGGNNASLGNLTYTEDGITYSGGGAAIRSNDPSGLPTGGTDRYLNTAAGNPVAINFGNTGVKAYFGLLWGSINPTNSVAFFRNIGDVNAFQTFTGQDILTRLGLNTNGETTAYVNFFGNNYNDTFARVVLSTGSDNIAFQSDNHAFRRDIPTPALLPGLVGLGLAAWRKRKGEAAETVGVDA